MGQVMVAYEPRCQRKARKRDEDQSTHNPHSPRLKEHGRRCGMVSVGIHEDIINLVVHGHALEHRMRLERRPAVVHRPLGPAGALAVGEHDVVRAELLLVRGVHVVERVARDEDEVVLPRAGARVVAGRPYSQARRQLCDEALGHGACELGVRLGRERRGLAQLGGEARDEAGQDLVEGVARGHLDGVDVVQAMEDEVGERGEGGVCPRVDVGGRDDHALRENES